MTYDPNQPWQNPSPLPYASGGYAPQNPRPGVMTALAVVSIVLSIFLILCMVIMIGIASSNPEMVEVLQSDELLWQWSMIGSGLRVVLGLALLAGAIGLLSLKPWARGCLTVYAAVMILTQLIDIYVSAKVMGRLDASPVAEQQAGQYIGYTIWIGHAIWTLIYVNGQSARQALSRASGVPAAMAYGAQQPYGYPSPSDAQPGYPQQTGYPQEPSYPPQGINPQQGNDPQQDTYPPQGNYPPQAGYPPNDPYSKQ